MKKIIVIILFCAVLVLPTAVWFACGQNSLDTFDVMKEKRNPAQFPSWETALSSESADFFAGVEAWFCDRLPFRTWLNDAYSTTRDKTAEVYASAVNDVYNAVHTHTYEFTETSEPTCTYDGYVRKTCRCGAVGETTVLPARGHDYTDTTVSPTCTEDGYTLHVCAVCGDTLKDTPTDALDHEYAVSTVERSCTSDGYDLHVCVRCGDNYRDNVVTAQGHTFTEWAVTKLASATEDGVRERTCTVCGETESLVIPKVDENHTHEYTDTVFAPTCTARGYTHHVCLLCGEAFDDTYTPMISHAFTVTTVKPTCLERGYDLYACSVCGMQFKDAYVAKSKTHTYGEWVTVKVATATEYGQKKRTCTLCGAEQTEKINKLSAGSLTANGFILGGAVDLTFNRSTSGLRTPDGYFVVNNVNNWILFTGDGNNSMIEDMTGQGLYSLTAKQAFAKRLQEASDACAAHGKTLVFTVCPNKSNIYYEYMIGNRSNNQRVDQMMKYLEANTTVKVVWSQALQEMFTYKDTYELFFRYDSHWNAAGGFVWANNILRTLGLPYTSLYDVPMTVQNRSTIPTSSDVENNIIGTSLWGIDQSGDLRAYTTGQYAADDKDYVINYLPGVTYSFDVHFNSRSYANNPEYTGFRAVSTSTNKQKCVLIGDSFRRALNPTLVKNFATYSAFFYTDMTKPACVNGIKDADVIIIEVTERLFDPDKIELFANYDILGQLVYMLDN